jgi:hypothetical protein
MLKVILLLINVALLVGCAASPKKSPSQPLSERMERYHMMFRNHPN